MVDRDVVVMAARETDRWRGATAALLLACVALVLFWEIMANRSRDPYQAFEITSKDFSEFNPQSETWAAEQRPVPMTAIEPNVLVYSLRHRIRLTNDEPRVSSAQDRVQVRLVHGYNMPDCMRIRGYEAELLDDRRQEGILTASGPRYQSWRLTSSTGEVSVRVVSMLRVGDFSDTDIDVCSMAFPRVGTPDDPRWLPQGITARSLRHPIRSLRGMLRSKWNNARCDPLTFLRLRRPAWASDELLTLVSSSGGSSIRPEQEAAAVAHVLAAHRHMLHELQAWRHAQLEDKGP